MLGLANGLERQAQFARAVEPLRALLLLGTRLQVSWQFLKSGRLKLTTWDVTLELFRSECQLPLLPAGVAAVAARSADSCSRCCSFPAC